MTKPISPADAITNRASVIPDKVIEAWNTAILEKFANGSSKVYQDDIVNRIVSIMDVPRQTVFDKHWLDVEDVFELAGWKVAYDKPGYSDDYSAYFLFEAP